jgi:hypothetical protein
MTTEIEPQAGESIRHWARRVRAYSALKFTVERLQCWPLVTVDDFTKLSGVSDWLISTIGESNFIWLGDHFWFTNDDDALLFKLAWSDRAS